jgi:hypothetical protein
VPVLRHQCRYEHDRVWKWWSDNLKVLPVYLAVGGWRSSVYFEL